MSTRKVTTTTTTQRKAKAPRRKRRAAKAANRNTSHAIQIAPCTRLYAKALVNPFTVQGLPCIPDNIVLPSYKFSTKARGVFSTGTEGVGFIVIDPFQMLAYDGSYIPDLTNPKFGGAIYYTSKDYDNADMVFHTAGTLETGVNVANPSSLFSLESFNINNVGARSRQFRLVGCGLRVNYIGSNMYNGGRLVIFRNQGNISINMSTAGITGSDLLRDQYTSITTVSRSPKYVYYVPDDADHISYNPYNDFCPNLVPVNTEEADQKHFSMGIYIDGGQVDPNQQSWEFEAVAFFEAVGSGMTLSKSHGDPVGHDVIMSSLPNSAPTTAPAQVENQVVNSFIKGFSETTREVAYNVGRKALGFAVNSAMNYYSGGVGNRQLLLTND